MRKPYLGIWLDHTEAYLIWADEEGDVKLQHKEAERLERGRKGGRTISGGTGVYGGLPPHADMGEKRRREAERLYRRIFSAARGATRLYIFGPGQAKKELAKRLREHKDFGGEIGAVASAGKMTQAQMVARVKDFFGLLRSAL